MNELSITAVILAGVVFLLLWWTKQSVAKEELKVNLKNPKFYGELVSQYESKEILGRISELETTYNLEDQAFKMALINEANSRGLLN